ncbi:MAG: M20/M25/M40 family metallo-hydrolase [Muribaculaceae bacterium]|nr:M20/M25/M40 family metallo-hydrolase [Muribaculaceae bacterium]MDE6753739.1 M20/M25/M40 family metallo-hydrolase [Muribaculaceae bacterium]
MENVQRHPRFYAALALLRQLIATPSPSREESDTADIWQEWLTAQGVSDVRRLHNNVWAVAPGYDSSRPTLMLNSHHDTVRPAASWTRNPFSPDIVEGKLFGLGSNDAGASGVTLASSFLDLMNDTSLPYNLILAITAAEEVMGEHGMRAFLPHLKESGMTPDMVLVGEPTGMQPAIAERGLLVFDAVAKGKSGHAARNEGINAIYRAMEDIERLRKFSTPVVSEVLGPVKVSVTMINAGTQHNVVPDKCTYVVDVRTTDAYSNEETVGLIRESVKWSELTPRSTRVHASVIPASHPLVKGAVALGKTPFVSPTTSDMALMHGINSLKMGPGESSRSHTADEFILLDEIDEALRQYPRLLKNLKFEN